MTVATVFGLLTALFKAIPTFKEWVDSFMAYYAQKQLADMKQENIDAIRKAIQDHDQRDLEKAVGNPNPGMPSGDAGAVVVDAPPPNIHH